MFGVREVRLLRNSLHTGMRDRKLSLFLVLSGLRTSSRETEKTDELVFEGR